MMFPSDFEEVKPYADWKIKNMTKEKPGAELLTDQEKQDARRFVESVLEAENWGMDRIVDVLCRGRKERQTEEKKQAFVDFILQLWDMLKLTEEEKANIEDVYNTNGSKKFVAQTFGQGKVDKEQTIMKYLEGLSEPKPEPEEEIEYELTAKTKATIDKLLASDYAIDDIPTTLQASAPMKLLIEEYIESRLLSDPQKQQVDMCLKINQP